jgi:uncharacterized protein (TIGR02246 family)
MTTPDLHSTAPSISEHEDQAIRAVVAQATDAQADPESLLALHDADAIVVNFGGRRVIGREAFGEAMRAALATPLADVTTEVDVLDIRLTTPSVAIVSAVKTVHDGRSDEDGSPLPSSVGALTYVLVKGDAGWRIALAQTTPILA